MLQMKREHLVGDVGDAIGMGAYAASTLRACIHDET
jgi:hypothetical protein